MTPSFLRTLTLTFAGIAALFVIDTFLAKMERSEDRAEAARQFAAGQRLMSQGRYADAIGPLSNAASSQRGNNDYRLELAEAYRCSGRFMDAQTLLEELLEEDSTDGPANLAMARVLVQEGKTADGISFYHRAIYGQWRDHPEQNKFQVRSELVNLLASQNAKEDLLAELLPLQEEAPEDLATRQRIGLLFIAAGSYPHAVEVFRGILRTHPQDADAYAGLGEAEAARGNYQLAQADFFAAAHLKPQDESIRSRLDVNTEVLALDPTERGLDSRERYRRSVKLLELALDDSSSCTAMLSDQALLESAAQAAKLRVSDSGLSVATEKNLDLAEQLWSVRRKQCPPQPASLESPLALVLAKINQ